ncbi:type I glyceraldehyde-3-phosphate dehydrogenase [Candidatus Uhrbacteria bacterium]|nr:type I glyceraldehyde-3-phosphate dehydrogenase [Candidatus Uhrbacteria bacterium]
MPIRIAINGFGRIGRNTLKAGIDNPNIEFVAVNDLTDSATLAHLLKYDTVFGAFQKEISHDEKNIFIDGKTLQVIAEKEPEKLPWKALNVDVVLECTGRFTNIEDCKKHLTAGAKRVIVSAPVKGGVPTYVFGANAHKYAKEPIINNASCTTNCISPIATVLHGAFGIAKALMTTIHAVTAEQNIVDGPPPGLKKGDMRRARIAYQNIVPTTTGAAIATTEAIPELKGLFDGLAMRVPIADVSLTDFVFVLKKKTTVEEINALFKKVSQDPMYKGIIGVTEEQLVSSDFIGSSYSTVVDLSLTKVIDGDLVKIIAWYDNEWGYSCRLAEMAEHVGSTI